MRHFLSLHFFALLLAGTTCVCTRCCAQDETPGARPTVEKIRVGFDGKYKVGCWTPVWVSIKGATGPYAGQLELTVDDADGVPARYTRSAGIDLPAGGETTVVTYVKFGRQRSGLSVELRELAGAATNKAFPAADLPAGQPSNSELVVTVGRSIGVEEAQKLRRRSDERFAGAVISRAANLPDRWWGYEGVDVVCLAGSQTDLVQQLSDEQLAALEMWVRLGGRLVLSVGAAGETLLGAEGRLARFNPGRFVEVVQQRRTADLERYAGAAQALVLPGQDEAVPLMLSVLSDLRFREEAGEGSGVARHPTIVRFPLGLGQVVLATIDLDEPPVAGWPGRPRLVARLLEVSANVREETPGERQLGQLTHVGFEDLGGQLRGALDQFSAVPLFSFSWIAGLLIVYVLLIGPGDYFFLRRFTGRMELTWLTLSLVVLLFCGGAVFLAFLWKGSELRLNQVDLVDVDLESGLVRGTSWANLYTPRTEEFDLTLEPTPPLTSEPAQALLTWQGLPGKGLGGMDGGAAAALFHRPYAIVGGAHEPGEPARLEHLPVQVSATKSLTARWWANATLPSAGKLAADADGRLQGELVNPLSTELQDCVLFYESSAYKLKPKLGPGERIVLTSQSPVVHAERRLTQRRVVESGETKAAWDAESFDIPRILEVMMFHDAAGGRGYTGLSNRQQPFVDLSGHLKTGRAVLLGRSTQPASRLLESGEPVAGSQAQHFAFYRLVIPVGKAGRSEPR